jgi:hypothetical protein
MITVPKYGRPPEMEYRQAVHALGERTPSDIHYLLGASAASYAIILLVLTGIVVAPLPSGMIKLAFVAGMLGGWVIREVADRGYRADLRDEAWRRYGVRRQQEFAAYKG